MVQRMFKCFDIPLLVPGQVRVAGPVSDPFVALAHSLTPNDYARLSKAGPSDVAVDGNICRVVYPDYIDPET